jgi:hypothetical protein
LQHQGGGGHAGEQGDLGVVLLDGQRRPQDQLPTVAVLLDLLLGQGQVDRAAIGCAAGQQRTQLGQQRDRLGCGARVDVRLQAGVVELGPAAHPRSLQGDAGDLAVGVQVDGPQHRGAVRVGQQAHRALAEHRRVQRNLAVREVDGLAANPRLGLKRAARPHVGGDVGDRVAHPIAAGPAGELHRLVEVARGGRIHRDERDVGAVDARRCDAGRGLLRLPHRVGRELGR